MSGSLFDLGVAVATFAVIFPAELPDKTLVATLVLSTRLRPLPVWIGVCLAFAVQCLVAVAFGGLLNLLPRGPVLLGAGTLFAAEWGDLSQLVTAGLAARYGDPLSVFVGSWLALCTVGGLAALAGRQLALRLPIGMIRRGAGVVFAVIASITLVEGFRALG